MLPPTMPISLTTSSQSISNGHLSSGQNPVASAPLANGAMMNGLHPNATYYPMQVFYYPTPPISPSIYLQTGQMHQGPMTFVLRGKYIDKNVSYLIDILFVFSRRNWSILM
jgi:hypothetical protein